MINQINNNRQPDYAKPATYSKDSIEGQDKAEEKKNPTAKTDTAEFARRPQESVTYTNINAKKLSSSEISSLKSMAEQANENLKRIVEQLILRQGKSHEILQIKGLSSSIDVSAKNVEEARQAISENGEFGVKAVSDRLVEFAKAVSGGDKTKFGELKGAIEQGFEEARKAFGGSLPEISHETYRETMRKLEEWANE